MLTVRPAVAEDVPALCEHWRRHTLENGRDGDFIFAPFEEPRSISSVQAESLEKSVKWSRPLDEPGWQRTWIITDGTQIFGELNLVNSPPVKSSLHRALIMMGMERSIRGQGYGSLLMQAALDWAKAQPQLEWLQLQVFDHNEPAKRLYAKFGFQNVGVVEDCFRVFGKRIDDITMTLKLRP